MCVVYMFWGLFIRESVLGVMFKKENKIIIIIFQRELERIKLIGIDTKKDVKN